MVISVGNGMLIGNDPNSLSEFGGGIKLTDILTRSVFKSINWVKRKGTTTKDKPIAQFLAEEKFTFQRAILTWSNYDIRAGLVINLDQTPLSFVSPVKYTFNIKGTQKVPIKGVDGRLQINAIFENSAAGTFLPMPLIFPYKTKRCSSNFQLPRTFHITYVEKNWSNQTKAVQHFEKAIFTYFEKVKKEKGHSKNKYCLLSGICLKDKITKKGERFVVKIFVKFSLFLTT